MRFTKMQGAGNDYVYVDCFAEPMPDDPAELARQVADRHYGIGGDGLILVCPSDVADVRMRMFNADGSEAEMCGNGVRCVAKYTYDHGLARKPRLRVETGAGVLTLDVEVEGEQVSRVRVDMGRPILAAGSIPVELPEIEPNGRVIDVPLSQFTRGTPAQVDEAWVRQCGLDERITCVSMGNPHAVLFCGTVERVPLEAVGAWIERLPAFPKRVNVHFVEVHGLDEVTMRTWERGSGITLACGTGASAVCVAGALTGRTKRDVRAHLPGGDLDLEWSADDHLYMTGPAVEVFSGDWPPGTGGAPTRLTSQR